MIRNVKNEEGSILVVTLAFILIFTLLGFGSLHLAYVQNEIAEKEKASAKAFWIADGAVQNALRKWNEGSDPTASGAPVNLGDGTYVYSSCAGSNCVITLGAVNDKSRSIKTEATGSPGDLDFSVWEEI